MEQTITQTAPAETIQANISGEVSGQVVVGNYNLTVGPVHGGVVNILQAERRPRLAARPAPVLVLPRRFAGLLDRTGEVSAAAKALPVAQPVEFYAGSGTGKTALLRSLAHHALAAGFPDGVIYLSARDQAPGDLLQSIFDALFEYEANYKPSEGEIRRALQNKNALILLDDVELSREEVESLMDAAPASTFLLASPERKLWGGGQSLNLPGLPLPEARTLLERELGRSLSEEERAAVDELCSVLHGHPFEIIQAAALARERNIPLARLAVEARQGKADRKLAGLLLGPLNKPEKQVVAALASLKGAPLRPSHVPAITGLPQAGLLLDGLQKRGVVQDSEAGFSLAGGISRFVQENWNLEAWQEGMQRYFQSWAEARLQEPHTILEEAEAIRGLIGSAVERGAWEGVLGLVRGVESALAVGRRWKAWEQVLQAGLDAAQHLGRLKEKAWALHQLGTRSLCLGERTAARSLLVQALRLRESLGDRAGAAVTRHNLSLLIGPPGNNGRSSNGKPPRGGPRLFNLGLGALAGLTASSAILAAALFFSGILFPAPPIPTAAPEGRIPPPAAPIAATATITATVTPTAGSIVQQLVEASATPGSVAAPTGTPTTPTDAPASCVPPSGWPVYTVQRGDTLNAIARATGSTTGELAAANCLADPDRIPAGLGLYVPQLPEAIITDTPAPTDTPTLTPTTPPPLYPDLVIALDVLDISREEGEAGPLDFRLSYAGIFSNQGEKPAGPFQVAVYYQPVVVGSRALSAFQPQAFQVTIPLAPGGSQDFKGSLSIRAEPDWEAIKVWAVVDDCRGLETTHPCQVEESDEANNTSETGQAELPNEPPRAEIFVPDSDITHDYSGFDKNGWYTELEIMGAGYDTEEEKLDQSSLAWTTDRTDIQPGDLGTGGQPVVRLYSPSCEHAIHTLTLTVTDARGAQGTAQRQVTLWAESCTPVLKVELPQGGTYPLYSSHYDDSQQRYALYFQGQVSVRIAGNPIPEDRVEWTTDQPDLQEGLTAKGVMPGFNLYLPNADPEGCDTVTHTIRITILNEDGTDSGISETISITLEEAQECYGGA